MGNKRERKWVHEVNMKRRQFGEIHHLMKQLRQDKVIFKEYEGVSKSPRTMLITRKSLVVHLFPAKACCGGVL